MNALSRSIYNASYYQPTSLSKSYSFIEKEIAKDRKEAPYAEWNKYIIRNKIMQQHNSSVPKFKPYMQNAEISISPFYPKPVDNSAFKNRRLKGILLRKKTYSSSHSKIIHKEIINEANQSNEYESHNHRAQPLLDRYKELVSNSGFSEISTGQANINRIHSMHNRLSKPIPRCCNNIRNHIVKMLLADQNPCRRLNTYISKFMKINK